MNWNEQYSQFIKPDFNIVTDFIDNELYTELCAAMHSQYAVQPELHYSGCSAQPGWNIKYRKSGKALCTLYPMPGYFIALVVIGLKEQAATELLLPSCSAYVRNLYAKTPFSAGGKWLMLNVTDHEILRDTLNLIAIRVGARKKAKV